MSYKTSPRIKGGMSQVWFASTVVSTLFTGIVEELPSPNKRYPADDLLTLLEATFFFGAAVGIALPLKVASIHRQALGKHDVDFLARLHGSGYLAKPDDQETSLLPYPFLDALMDRLEEQGAIQEGKGQATIRGQDAMSAGISAFLFGALMGREYPKALRQDMEDEDVATTLPLGVLAQFVEGSPAKQLALPNMDAFLADVKAIVRAFEEKFGAI